MSFKGLVSARRCNVAKVFPHQGDIIWIDAEPHAGREEGGHDPNGSNIQRPMIVLSRDGYNRNTKMIFGMMLMSTSRYLAPELHKAFFDEKSGIHGKIIMWQIPNYDYEARHARIVGHIDDRLLGELLQWAQNIFK